MLKGKTGELLVLTFRASLLESNRTGEFFVASFGLPLSNLETNAVRPSISVTSSKNNRRLGSDRDYRHQHCSKDIGDD